MFDHKLPDDVQSVHVGRSITNPALLLFTVRLVHATAPGSIAGPAGTSDTFTMAYEAALRQRERLNAIVPRETVNV
jgi:hypothetical protein